MSSQPSGLAVVRPEDACDCRVHTLAPYNIILYDKLRLSKSDSNKFAPGKTADSDFIEYTAVTPRRMELAKQSKEWLMEKMAAKEKEYEN